VYFFVLRGTPFPNRKFQKFFICGFFWSIYASKYPLSTGKHQNFHFISLFSEKLVFHKKTKKRPCFSCTVYMIELTFSSTYSRKFVEFLFLVSKYYVPPADLGEGARGDCAPLRENFFDFSQQKRTKNEFILPRMDLKKWFLSTTTHSFEKSALPSQILDPPLLCTALFFQSLQKKLQSKKNMYFYAFLRVLSGCWCFYSNRRR